MSLRQQVGVGLVMAGVSIALSATALGRLLPKPSLRVAVAIMGLIFGAFLAGHSIGGWLMAKQLGKSL